MRPSVVAVIVDARRGLQIGVDERDALVAVPTPPPPAGTAFPPRRLTLAGTAAFELALWCGTCPAVFERLAAPDLAAVELAQVRLDGGLSAVDDDVVRAHAAALPRSTYSALLVDLVPALVLPGGADDYFAHEQVATWGVDPVLGRPEDPGTPYYRTFQAPVSASAHLYEVVVPLVPPSWNDVQRVSDHAGDPGPVTALAYSLLDVVQPAVDDESEDYHEHWVLSHFLLDGHHKVAAAAEAGRPVRLLSLLDEGVSLATHEDVSRLVEVRDGPPGQRAR